jgi:hypothetical protein
MKIELGRASVDIEDSQEVVIVTDASKSSKGSLASVQKGKEVGQIVLEWESYDKASSSLSNAGNGTKVYRVGSGGFYLGKSMVRSYEQRTYYFLPTAMKLNILILNPN